MARCRRALPTPRASEEEGSSGRTAWPSKEGPILVDTSPIRLENYADATEFPPPPLDALPILTSFTTLDISDDRWIKKKFCSNRAFFDYETNTRSVQLCRLLSSLVTGSHSKLFQNLFEKYFLEIVLFTDRNKFIHGENFFNESLFLIIRVSNRVVES